MALTTLPYPSMDFVPLDILTAEEMNQLVANIEAINNATIGTNQIADNAITTAKLNDSAVTSSKIDWTTLGLPKGIIYQEWSGGAITLPTGNYSHRFEVYFVFPTSSSNGGLKIIATNSPFTGTTWIRRFNLEGGNIFASENSITNGREFIYGASEGALTTISGTGYFSGTIHVSGVNIRAHYQCTVSGTMASQVGDSQAILKNTSTPLVLMPARTNGTVNTSSIVGYVESIPLG